MKKVDIKRSRLNSEGRSRILIVEDDSSLIYALRSKFLQSGFETMIALNGDIAQEIAEHMSVHVILLDILLPKLNGFEVLSRLKEVKTTRHIPVIVFSNLDDSEDKERALRLGASGYYMKSNISIDELVEVVSAAVIKAR